jgi:hypothetical protein
MVTSKVFSEFRVPKTTGTHGDVFAAVGLADLLSQHPHGITVLIREEPTAFIVAPARPLTEDDLARLSTGPGYRFLKANEKVAVPPEVGSSFIDYKAEKARADVFRAAMQAAQSKGKGPPDPEALQQVQQLRPPPEWRLIQVLNSLQGDDAANAVVVAILRQTPDQATRRLVQELSAVHKGNASGSSLPGNLVQLFTPNAAKGYSRLKPDGTGRNDKTKDQWADPFWEWMKYRGYWHVAYPFFQGAKSEHVRLFCPVPANISFATLRDVVRELRKSAIFGEGPKLDALATLQVTRLLIEHSEECAAGSGAAAIYGLSIFGRRPSDVISGLMVTHYQSLGSAKAVSSMATLALPGWFPVSGPEDATAWLEILNEHQHVIRGLNESHSDEMGLLVKYRRFHEQRGEPALMALLEFVGEYGSFWLRVFGGREGRRPRRFTTALLRRVVEGMAPYMVKILEDPGFQAIAAAVRRATVSAQAQRVIQRQRGQPITVREIRYDLLPELRRKRTLPTPEPFMETVAEFISLYNAENVRRREMNPPLPAPRNVTTDEFVSFTRLVETYGASVVGALLCAFGSCREPREPDVEETGEDNQAAATADVVVTEQGE